MATLGRTAIKANVLYQPFLFALKNMPVTHSKTKVVPAATKYITYFVDHSRIIQVPKRQAECLRLLQGNTNKEIAKMLGLSFRTVEYYVELLRKKLNCRTKRELSGLAHKLRVIQA